MSIRYISLGINNMQKYLPSVKLGDIYALTLETPSTKTSRKCNVSPYLSLHLLLEQM